MSGVVLQLRNLEVAFRRDDAEQVVVDGVSLDLEAGKITGLVGESGCGKSVTAYSLMGLLPANSARSSATRLRLDDQELSQANQRQWQAVRRDKLAMIFQEPASALDPVFTVGSQLRRVIQRRERIGRSAANDAAIAALGASGFTQPEDLLLAYPHQLSGGMRQLVMIAMAMAVRPRVLIADEPTTALDVTTQALVIERLVHLSRTFGTAILLVTHDLGVAARCCQDVMVMYCGRLVEQGDYRAVFEHPFHPYTAGLIKAVPRARPGHKPEGIPGRVPSLSAIPGGCRFAPRCARADQHCLAEYPSYEDRNGRRVACHYPL